MDLFTKLKIPYYEGEYAVKLMRSSCSALALGCLIVEVRDQRPKGRNNEPPLPEKIILRPTAESINHDVKTNAQESRWGDKEALELESRLLVRPCSVPGNFYLNRPLARHQRATDPGSRPRC